MADEASKTPCRRTTSTLRRDLVLTSCLTTAAFALVVCVSVFVPLAAQLGRAEMSSTEIVGLADYFLFLHATFWPVIGLSLAASISSGLLLYVRMRAPLVRFVRVYRAIQAGDVPSTLRIRSRDYLWEEADALNDLIHAMGKRDRRRADFAARFSDLASRLMDHGLDDATVAELNALEKHAAISAPVGVTATRDASDT